MEQPNPFLNKEKLPLIDTVKNLITVTGIATVIVVMSLVIVDLVVYPIALFAVNHTEQFTSLVTRGMGAAIMLMFIITIFHWIREVIRNRYTWRDIALSIITKPVRILVIILGTASALVFVITVLFLILNYNSIILSRLFNG